MTDLTMLKAPQSGGASLDILKVQALSLHAVQATIASSWEVHTGRLAPLAPAADQKEAIALEKILKDYNTYQVLMTVWLQSPYIADAEVCAAGLSRPFPDGPMTCHGIAIQMSPSAASVGRVHKRIQAVLKAAAAYGLVQKKALTAKKHEVLGTQVLHDLMLSMSDDHATALAERLGSLPTGVSA